MWGTRFCVYRSVPCTVSIANSVERARSPRSRDGCRKPCRGAGRQAMRASLLASAMASLCRCKRSDAVFSHAPKLNRDQVCGRIRRTLAAWTSNMRKYRLPRLEIRPRIDYLESFEVPSRSGEQNLVATYAATLGRLPKAFKHLLVLRSHLVKPLGIAGRLLQGPCPANRH